MPVSWGHLTGTLLLGEGKPPVHVIRPDSISEEANQRRNAFRQQANQRFENRRRQAESNAYSYSFEMAEQLQKRTDLFDESKFAPRDVQRYGSHKHGRHMLLARNLLEAGVTFVEVRSYHWDTHCSNFDSHLDMVSDFDRPFAALIEDLDASGRLENTLVIVLSEFGRTPKINFALGRDHWPQAWSMCMGAAESMVGRSTGKRTSEEPGSMKARLDTPRCFTPSFTAMGINTLRDEYDNDGQPLPIADEDYKPIESILA